jgi:hypothetical protein
MLDFVDISNIIDRRHKPSVNACSRIGVVVDGGDGSVLPSADDNVELMMGSAHETEKIVR